MAPGPSYPPLEIDSYVPIPPLSPLAQLHARLTGDYNRTTAELKVLNSSQHQQQSQQTAIATLSHVRRLLETAQLLKSKLATLSAQLSASAMKTVLDFQPATLAVNLTFIDWDAFRVSSDDLAAFADNPAAPTPASLRSALDWSLQLSRLVQSSVLQPSTPQLRGKAIGQWCAVIEVLAGHRNFQSMDAVLHGLTNPAVTRLERSWAFVNRRWVQRLEEWRLMLGPGPADDHARYKGFTVAGGAVACLPLLRSVLRDVVVGNETQKAMALSAFDAQRGGSVEAPAGGGGGGKGLGGANIMGSTSGVGLLCPLVGPKDIREKSDVAMHWLMSREWKPFANLMNRSEAVEMPMGGGRRFLETLRGRGGGKSSNSFGLDGVFVLSAADVVSLRGLEALTMPGVHGPLVIPVVPGVGVPGGGAGGDFAVGGGLSTLTSPMQKGHGPGSASSRSTSPSGG
ncbi:hypothetical protein HK101_001315, partial [Irineochytrium annulatum]